MKKFIQQITPYLIIAIVIIAILVIRLALPGIVNIMSIKIERTAGIYRAPGGYRLSCRYFIYKYDRNCDYSSRLRPQNA
jgi:hypothetical protein